MTTTPYQPELGQLVKGESGQIYAAPNLLTATLSYLQYALDLARRNVNQEWDEASDSPVDIPDPFHNTGESFECPTFQVHAYAWDDEDRPVEERQTWNFRWREVEVRWYKYLGRGMSVNVPITPERIAELLDECLAAIEKWEEENDTD